ncbi:MAG: hypothetical protein MUC52_02915 [Candidatus Omnitrophica bacterium]|nr:hypothetical protein [Candidatus Omnitrophota bacterium]
MKNIVLKPRKFNPDILSFLAKRGLVRPLVPTADVRRCRSYRGAVGTIYKSKENCGTHKLICVRCATDGIKINSHKDNEEFILISPDARRFNPLYMIIGLHKHAVIEAKAKKGSLDASDFLAVELVYNDPRVSIFTMLEGTPHFEIGGIGSKQAPIFFVTEPSRLKLHKLKLQNFCFSVRE